MVMVAQQLKTLKNGYKVNPPILNPYFSPQEKNPFPQLQKKKKKKKKTAPLVLSVCSVSFFLSLGPLNLRGDSKTASLS